MPINWFSIKPMAPGRKPQLRVLRGFDVPAEGRGVAAMIAAVRIVGLMNDVIARLVKPHGLTSAHFDVLMTLKAGEGISQQELSERLLMTKGNACVTVQKMEVLGLVERRADPTDQRFQRPLHDRCRPQAAGQSPARASGPKDEADACRDSRSPIRRRCMNCCCAWNETSRIWANSSFYLAN